MSWISFRGVRSDALGAVVSKMPSPDRAARRVQRYAPPARHGILHVVDGSYDAVTLDVVLNLFGLANKNTINQWLDGSGDLILSDEPDKCYRAAIYDDIQYERIKTYAKRFDRLTVRFECHPFRYEASPVVRVISAPGNLNNTGTVESEPVITVTGTGAGTITIGGEMIQLEGMDGSIVIDSEARQVYAAAAGAKMTGEFPLLPIGSSAVSFSGGVTGLTVLQNTRWK